MIRVPLLETFTQRCGCAPEVSGTLNGVAKALYIREARRLVGLGRIAEWNIGESTDVLADYCHTTRLTPAAVRSQWLRPPQA
jgi:hypothetical protein